MSQQPRMWAVTFRGPRPVIIPIRDAVDEQDAIAKAKAALPMFGEDPDQFEVERVIDSADFE